MKLVRVTSRSDNVEANAGQNRTLHYGMKIAAINSKASEHGVRLLYATINLDQSKITGFKFEHAVTGCSVTPMWPFGPANIPRLL